MTCTTPGRCSRHIGRAGALAFALGVGFAIANAPGIAAADTGSSTAHSARQPTKAADNRPGPKRTRVMQVTARPSTAVASPRRPVVPTSATSLTDLSRGLCAPRSRTGPDHHSTRPQHR
ncbi:hypothetical protein BayCH28_22415 [Mycolicibacterium sp. CH28]|nr:hypothetical protein BayCH28_22415 [Mycolicibacterium sp. CH28]